MTKVLKVTMHLERETAGSVLYKSKESEAGDPSVQNIYVKKWALERPFPKQVVVTVEVP